MLNVLSTMVGWQETFVNCRCFTLAKTAIFWHWWLDGVFDWTQLPIPHPTPPLPVLSAESQVFVIDFSRKLKTSELLFECVLCLKSFNLKSLLLHSSCLKVISIACQAFSVLTRSLYPLSAFSYRHVYFCQAFVFS